MGKSDIDESQIAAIRGYTSDVLGCDPRRITAISRFEDGNRHAVYKVSYPTSADTTEHLVVRVSFGSDVANCAQAEREAHVLDKVGGVAGPLLYDFRCTSRWFETSVQCMQFVTGRQEDLRFASGVEIERLASLVARLHTLPLDDFAGWAGTTGDIASYAEERLQSILSGLTWVRDPLPRPIQDRLKSAAGSIERHWRTRRQTDSFSSGRRLALLHGDIGPGNVLWCPDPILIDWEYTRLGDPSDEIAYLFDQNGLTGRQREAFWSGYRDAVISEKDLSELVARTQWWELLTLLGSSLWWVERWVRRMASDMAGRGDPALHRDPAYYFEHMSQRLRRLEDLLR